MVDSILRPYDYQGDIPELFKQYIASHNEQVEETKQFEVGEITVTDPNNYVHYSSTVYPNVLNEIKEKLVNTHGGYIRTRVSGDKRYVDYVKKPGITNSQIIEFGSNLLDITEYITAENVFTVLVPLGERLKDEDGNETGRLTIAEVNDGKDYIESETGIKLFGSAQHVDSAGYAKSYGHVTSANRNEYPSVGLQDGFRYEYKGTIGQALSKIEKISSN